MDQKQVFADQDQSSMLKVICNQRDRFRARLRETEEVFYLLKTFTICFLSVYNIIIRRWLDYVLEFAFPTVLGNKTTEGEDWGADSGAGKDKS